jgi:transporter family protein
MKPQLFALLTAMAWGIGGYFEKKGLHLGHLSPQMGITIRTAVAVVILGIVSYPDWKSVPAAGPGALLSLVIGGGIVAFTSPLFGVLMGVLAGGESLSAKGILGILMTVGGIVLLTIG